MKSPFQTQTADDIPIISIGTPPEYPVVKKAILPIYEGVMERDQNFLGPGPGLSVVLPLARNMPLGTDNWMIRARVSAYMNWIRDIGGITPGTTDILRTAFLDFLNLGLPLGSPVVVGETFGISLPWNQAHELVYDIWDKQVTHIRLRTDSFFLVCPYVFEINLAVRGAIVCYEHASLKEVGAVVQN